jgi:hypothetical protein
MNLLNIKYIVITNMHIIHKWYKLRGRTSRNPINSMEYITRNVRSALSTYHENTNEGLPVGLPGNHGNGPKYCA